jgi:hypothetical protein
MGLEGLGSVEKSNSLTANRTRNLPACTTVPQPTMLSRPILRLLVAIFFFFLRVVL